MADNSIKALIITLLEKRLLDGVVGVTSAIIDAENTVRVMNEYVHAKRYKVRRFKDDEEQVEWVIILDKHTGEHVTAHN